MARTPCATLRSTMKSGQRILWLCLFAPCEKLGKRVGPNGLIPSHHMEQINKVKVSFGRISWSSVSLLAFAPWRHNSTHRSSQRQSCQQERKVMPRRCAIIELCEPNRMRWETLKTFVNCEQTVTVMWNKFEFYFLDKGLQPKRWTRANKDSLIYIPSGIFQQIITLPLF